MKKINFTRIKRKIVTTFRFRRLKMVEQSLIVLLFAVLIPMTIGGVVISNINQHVVRAQLRENASLIADMVSAEIDFFIMSAVEGEDSDINDLDIKLFKSIDKDKR